MHGASASTAKNWGTPSVYHRIDSNKNWLCKECSQQHAPWIDATVMEITSNPSDSDSPETEDSGQEGRTGAGWYASDLQHRYFSSSDSETDRGDYSDGKEWNINDRRKIKSRQNTKRQERKKKTKATVQVRADDDKIQAHGQRCRSKIMLLGQLLPPEMCNVIRRALLPPEVARARQVLRDNIGKIQSGEHDPIRRFRDPNIAGEEDTPQRVKLKKLTPRETETRHEWRLENSLSFSPPRMKIPLTKGVLDDVFELTPEWSRTDHENWDPTDAS